jgi:uncharacterized cupredoxin-like copper-binding protein
MQNSQLRISLLIAAVLAVIVLATAAACSSDAEDGGPRVTVEAGSNPDVEADPEAGGEPQPGVVQPKPEGAAQVDVTLREWAIEVAAPAVAAGQVYFLVDNVGPDDAHEFVVVRTDEAPDALPVVDGRVPEDDVDIVDEIEPFLPATSASLTLDLEPGSYVFLCNIAEVKGFELQSHYQLGMRTAFTVE